MKDLGEAVTFLGSSFCEIAKKECWASQASYIDEILARYSMQDLKKGFVPFRVGSSLLVNQWPKTPAEIEDERYSLYFGSGKSHVCHAVY